MIRVDPFLDRVLTPKYKCLDFVREVWLDAFGVDVKERLQRLSDAIHAKRITTAVLREFRQLAAPIDPCFVLMIRPGVTPHIGIYVRGRVLHLSYPHAEYQPVETARRGFLQVRYYV